MKLLKKIAPDALATAGLLTIGGAFYAIYPPLAFLLLGAGLIAIAIALELLKNRSEAKQPEAKQ